jgi:glycosyltransferase involved in cell wall biosynthesis
MRILHILNDIRELGNGIINVTVDLACLQAEAGHQVAVVSAGGEYESLLVRYQVQHYYLNQQRRPLNLLKAAYRFQQIVQQFQPDVVHAQMVTGAVLAWVCKHRYSYALVSTVHNEFQRSARLMGLADRIIAVSQAVADAMQARGIPFHKLRVVCNGTLGSPRQKLIQSDQQANVSLQHPAIVTVAGMYERKGIAELIVAFEQLATAVPAHLYLVGNGPDRAKFERQASQTSAADRIHFEGFQPQPQRYLKVADIFVLASRQEPFGLVLSEAREAGCAIIATNVDGIPEALDQGKAGILIPPADVNALTQAIRQLLENPVLLNEWRNRARQNLSWLTIARVHQEILAVYQEQMQLAAKVEMQKESIQL